MVETRRCCSGRGGSGPSRRDRTWAANQTADEGVQEGDFVGRAVGGRGAEKAGSTPEAAAAARALRGRLGEARLRVNRVVTIHQNTVPGEIDNETFRRRSELSCVCAGLLLHCGRLWNHAEENELF